MAYIKVGDGQWLEGDLKVEVHLSEPPMPGDVIRFDPVVNFRVEVAEVDFALILWLMMRTFPYAFTFKN